MWGIESKVEDAPTTAGHRIYTNEAGRVSLSVGWQTSVSQMRSTLPNRECFLGVRKQTLTNNALERSDRNAEDK
jgi:hypothetical protein